ncbi:MAG TPA: PHB depolymerase family esterase [Thermoanaerobaculia bacterium]
MRRPPIRWFATLSTALVVSPLALCAGTPERVGTRFELADAPCAELPAGDHDRLFHEAGEEREVRLHVPPGERPDSLPLVLVFHGGGQSGPRVAELVDMDRVADAERFLVAYPTGTRGIAGGYTWNGGACCGAAMRRNVDDVAFVSHLVRRLVEEGCVEPRRVYATGVSNGAVFVYRLGCEISEQIAAIAPIAGAMMVDSCRPQRPVPAIVFHGTGDRDVPVEGGRNLQSGARRAFPPLDESLATLLRINGCDRDARVVYDEGDATCRAYQGCSPGGAVTFCRIHGGGHTWPGGQPFRAERLGKTSQDISASREMWEFFDAHPLPSSASEDSPQGVRRESPRRERP